MTRRTLTLEGLGVSPGIAIGRAVCIESRELEVYRLPLPEEAIESEVLRLDQAVKVAESELSSTRVKAEEQLGDELAAIFEAQSMLLTDRALLQQVTDRIRSEKVNAEWAVHKTAEELGHRFDSLDVDHFRERGEDLRDVSRLLLRALQGVSHHELSELGSEVIIVTHDLTPSEAVRLGRQHVVAFAIETGGPTSHTAIIARDLNIPLVAGLVGVTENVTDDDPVIVDGGEGRVILHPTEEVLARHRGLQDEQHQQELQLLGTRVLPCVTRDRITIDLMSNIDLPEEVRDAQRFGAAGIGLYRSEFLYIESSPVLPSEEDHVRLYSHLLDAVHPHPVVIRTFDLGGRKLAREVMATDEENPVLGLRGIRLTLARPEIFRTQVRALLRAGVDRNLSIMLPMISTLDELRQFRRFAAETMEELDREGLTFSQDYRLGVMIEVPAAAMIADILAREADFFSIGTNDLIQYSMAVDRNNEHVSYLYQPLHPGLLRMIRFVVQSAREAGIDVSMCGEMAADHHYTALLLGLGLRRLSVSPRMIPEIKTRIRDLRVADLEEMTKECLEKTTAREVEQTLESYLSAAGSLQG